MRFLGIVPILLAGFVIAGLLGYTSADLPELSAYPPAKTLHNYAGLPGAVVAAGLLNAFGYAAYFLAIPLMILGCRLIRGRTAAAELFGDAVLKTSGLLFAGLGLAGLLTMLPAKFALLPCSVAGTGGYGGMILSAVLVPYFTPVGASIILSSFILAGVILIADEELIVCVLRIFCFKRGATKTSDVADLAANLQQRPEIRYSEYSEKQTNDAPTQPLRQTGKKLFSFGESLRTVQKNNPRAADANHDYDTDYQLPEQELLVPSEPVDEDLYLDQIHAKAVQLKDKLKEFKIQAEVVDVQVGPVVSQFEIRLAKGTRVRKIQVLEDDLAVAFKSNVRIIAPIPGKDTVGVELPNEHRQTVRLRDVMDACIESTDSYTLPIFLGKDVSGAPLAADLAKMPHLLIAGTTGTGKSVCINSIIVSLLMTRTPEQVRMLMIDPKMVEMSAYKKIPHLLYPVVTDMEKAAGILGWAVDKMEERYQLLAAAGVKQLSEYNKLSEDDLRRRMGLVDAADEEWERIPKTMPSIVIIADEMADLMMTAGKEVESHIIRLAQKSRAVGIHLVLATQKPIVSVITTLIKSNLPARIAFGVSSGMDSKVILDRTGAERLLGKGDMLFLLPGTSDLVRGQGTFVSDEEIEKINELIATDAPDYADELLELMNGEEPQPSGGSEDNNFGGEQIARDDLYYQAVEYVIQQGRGSLSMLQRRFSIGYGRAARMIDFMAEDGVVGAYKGAKPRDVVINLGEWKRKAGAMGANRKAGTQPVAHRPTTSPAIPDFAETYEDEYEFVAD